ncbi:MAG: DNA methyltransferase [Rhodobacteraceae bacterium]|nr:DNA methyltransferase [Paracoccaceae bacterium]MCY4248984.1 DNA methyltransferase [Paracoccaceae bacterium]MCY4308608.1 DNA methyltransferase [Paracoccaceae bacterium]
MLYSTHCTIGQSKISVSNPEALALLEGIIEYGSNKNDMILGPFCGCTTTCGAADALGRQWVGIDMSPKAAELVKFRINDLTRTIVNRTDIPHCTDPGKAPSCRSHKKTLCGYQAGIATGVRSTSNSKPLRLTT